MKYAATLLALLVATVAGATTIVLPSDDQLIRKSDLVIAGRVLSTRPVLIDGAVWTETLIVVDKELKGSAPSVVTIRELGGKLPEGEMVVFGTPRYVAGERVLAFLIATPRGDFQTADLFVGKFSERIARDGRRIWHRDDEHEGTNVLDGRFRPLSIEEDVHRLGDEFERYIRGERSAQYLARDVEFRRAPVANFTLIDEPNIYRWFAFDTGGSAVWRSFGTQSGYTNGGVTELQTAMSAWTSYENARIRYSYSGTTSTPGRMNAPNGVNEVIFGDPLQDIAGTWDPSAGGVVGIGGFNNIASGGPWTSPFAADAAHPQRTFSSTGNILEGNLVIQDGVAPSRGISSTVLAEILAHEFGHTLGFGHSADRTALMYFQVTGGGPSLKTDDQQAASWLYPGTGGGGGGNPTAPAAPSNLDASVASDGRVTLSWRDNATNEALQRIYVAQGTGGFVLNTEVNANVTLHVVQNLVKGQTYSFRVTSFNSSGESSPSNTASVTIPSDQPVAAFSVSPVNGVAGVTLFTFTDRSTGPITGRVWTFGDGTTSTQQNPTHTYATPGVFTVSLTVTNGSVSSTASRNVVLTSPDAPVAANFSFLPASPSTIDSVTFLDESTGPVNSWQWDFGDATTSTERNPVKRFTAAGSYNVTLQVGGSNSTTSRITRVVTVATGSGGTGPVTADFDISVAAPTTSDTIAFRDTSTGVPNSWFWDFGDGFISTVQNPTHKYAKAGRYRVTFTAGNAGSSSTRVKEITVSDPKVRRRPVRP